MGISVDKFWAKVDRSGGPDACWPWKAGKSGNGYGSFKVDGRNLGASRVACELAHGPPPFEGAQALHSCDNPPCCNPAHLRWDTHAANMLDRNSRGRQARGERLGAIMREVAPRGDRHLSRTHPERLARGDRNGARLHPDRILKGDAHPSRTRPECRPRGERHGATMRRVAARGERHGNAKLTAADVAEIRAALGTQRSIAKRFGVSKTTVGGIRRGQAWAHVPSGVARPIGPAES